MSTIEVGKQVESALEYISDVDRYDVYLPGLKTYHFDVKGKVDGEGNWLYPRLAVFGGNTSEVASEKNEDRNTDVRITYKATSGGFYTVEVGGREETGQPSSSGGYSLLVSEDSSA
jgi:hypothetical protein